MHTSWKIDLKSIIREWETSNKFMDPLRYKDKDKVIITYVPDSEKNRKKTRKGRN